MASISGSQSGGKMVRLRRTAAARNRTPYSRPATPQHQPQSPNWLSRFVISPTRFIASGARKILSTVLDLESSPSSSSSATSSSSSYSDSVAEEVGEEAINLSVQPLVANSKSKNTIEQLLMQETFSREEGDRLIKIIRSRVVDYPANDEVSPVDVAKSYMQFKRDSSATWSWSIQDEIRRVRSRATEEMLRTVPSSKIDWSAFSVEHKNNVNSSAIEKFPS